MLLNYVNPQNIKGCVCKSVLLPANSCNPTKSLLVIAYLHGKDSAEPTFHMSIANQSWGILPSMAAEEVNGECMDTSNEPKYVNGEPTQM
eukprot:4686363-Amphidinium_carterae.1